MTTPKSSGFQPVVSVSKNSDILVNLHDKAGKWTFGDYYTGFSKKLGRNLMIKMVDLTKYPLKKSTLDTEIAILQKLKSCPYATEFMEYQYYNKSLTITTENYNGGNLREYLNKNAPIPEDQAIRLITQLVCGLKALHQLRFIHADVRPENILLHEQDGKITLKVSNFIFVRKYDGDRSANFPVPFDSLYRAPEVLTENLYYPESDIWSIGVIFYEMLYGALPWSGKTKDELRDNIINQRLNLESRPGISDTSIEFIYRCLNRETKKRIDWKTIGEHRLLFRALFMKDDGTYKLYNDEYKEFSPSKRNLMFGIRIAGGSMPGTPQNSRFDNTLKSGAGRPGFQTTKGAVDLDASGFSKALKYSSSFNLKMDQTPKLDAKLDSSTVKFKPEEIVSNLEGQQKDDTIPLDINIRIDEPVVEGEDEKESEVEGVPGESEKAELIETKTVPLEGSVDVKTDPSFYPHFAARVGETEDYYTAKNLNTDTIGEKAPFSKKSFVKPFKWLANKAEIVSEIYELASRNKKHCCYEKIIELLNEETNSWNTINLVANMQKQFADSVESSSKKEQNKTMVWPKQGKASQSVAKSEKSKKLAALVEEIVASLTNNSENAKSNNEDLVQIAADFKVLREFDEIGDNVMKELNAMKNTLVVFSRRKDHTHIRYLLVVRNLA